jgi:hypothetical protein
MAESDVSRTETAAPNPWFRLWSRQQNGATVPLFTDGVCEQGKHGVKGGPIVLVFDVRGKEH